LKSAARRHQDSVSPICAGARLPEPQIGALALGVMALLLLAAVRGDLMQNWRASLPPDAPNHFIVNVLPDQVDGVKNALREVAGRDVQLYPMIRGRLVAVNGQTLDTAKFTEPRARRLAEREFNLSYATELPSTNRVGGKVSDSDAGPDADCRWKMGSPNRYSSSWATR
jgi:putative ABC transport system permease protein